MLGSRIFFERFVLFLGELNGNLYSLFWLGQELHLNLGNLCATFDCRGEISKNVGGSSATTRFLTPNDIWLFLPLYHSQEPKGRTSWRVEKQNAYPMRVRFATHINIPPVSEVLLRYHEIWKAIFTNKSVIGVNSLDFS